jgi:hypothetical protein
MNASRAGAQNLHSPLGYEDSSAVKAEDAKFEKTGIESSTQP